MNVTYKALGAILILLAMVIANGLAAAYFISTGTWDGLVGSVSVTAVILVFAGVAVIAEGKGVAFRIGRRVPKAVAKESNR